MIILKIKQSQEEGETMIDKMDEPLIYWLVIWVSYSFKFIFVSRQLIHYLLFITCICI